LGSAKYQIVEFLHCYQHEESPCIVNGCGCRMSFRGMAMSTSPQSTSQLLPSLLTWHRCNRTAKGNAAKALQIYADLSQIGSKANFALNWPIGYLDTGFSGDGSIPVVRLSIRTALHQWNFRLNRSKRKAFTLADLWLVGVKLVLSLRSERLKNSCQGATTSIQLKNSRRRQTSSYHAERQRCALSKGGTI